jgi:hypothetical protein
MLGLNGVNPSLTEDIRSWLVVYWLVNRRLLLWVYYWCDSLGARYLIVLILIVLLVLVLLILHVLLILVILLVLILVVLLILIVLLIFHFGFDLVKHSILRFEVVLEFELFADS